jgi:hypothetical protein
MIDKYEILKKAKLLGLQPTTVEKDYVLGWAYASGYKNIWVHPVNEYLCS